MMPGTLLPGSGAARRSEVLEEDWMEKFLKWSAGLMVLALVLAACQPSASGSPSEAPESAAPSEAAPSEAAPSEGPPSPRHPLPSCESFPAS